MQSKRVGFIVAGFLTIASIYVTPALADMFYYRDARGQLHLTNVWSRIPKAYRDQATRNRRPEQGGPTRVTAPSVPMPTAPKARPQRDDKRIARSTVASPHAAPVTTRAFGLLDLRMSDFEVAQRLGPPAAISDVGQRTLAPAGSSHQVVRLALGGETWYYPGTARIPATRLDFQGGVLVNKERVHH